MLNIYNSATFLILDIIAQETPEAPVKESWAPSGIGGWFGIGKSNEKKEDEAKDRNMQTINEEAEPQKQPEETPEEKSGWLGGRIKTFLPFGEQRDEPQAEDQETDAEKASTQETDQEPRRITEDGEDSKSKWFHFGIRDALGFGGKNEKKEETRQNVEGTDNEMTPEALPQDKAMDSSLTSEQSDISRTDRDADSQEKDTAAPEKGGSDETQSVDVTLSRTDREVTSRISDNIQSTKTSEKQDPSPGRGTTRWFKSVVSNVLNLGKSHSKEKEIELGGAEDLLEGSPSAEVDESRQEGASDDLDRSLEASSPGKELNGLGSVVDTKDEFKDLTEIHPSKVLLQDATTFQDEGGEYEAEREDGNEYSETLSRSSDVKGLVHEVGSAGEEHAKDEVQTLKDVHTPKVHAMTEDNAFQDGGYDKKPRPEEAAPSTQTIVSGQEDDDHTVRDDEYSDTLSRETVEEAGSVTDNPGEAEVRNLEDTDQPKIVDKWTLEGEGEYEEEETFNPVTSQEPDEDRGPEDDISVTSHHLRDESADPGKGSPYPKTAEDTVEETSGELKIENKESIEREDRPVSKDDDSRKEPRLDGRTAGSIYPAGDETTKMETAGPGAQGVTDSQPDTSPDKGEKPASPRLKSQEDKTCDPGSREGDNDEGSYRNITGRGRKHQDINNPKKSKKILLCSPAIYSNYVCYLEKLSGNQYGRHDPESGGNTPPGMCDGDNHPAFPDTDVTEQWGKNQFYKVNRRGRWIWISTVGRTGQGQGWSGLI